MGVCLAFMTLWLNAQAVEIQILVLTQDKAIINVDGKRRVLKTGETSPEGVTLVDSNSDEAIIEVDGREEVYQLGVVATYGSVSDEPNNSSVTLYSDSAGFFYADGKINDRPARFLVDTGASSVAISSAFADSIGLDYSKGTPGIAETASGITRMVAVKLNSVSVGGIKVYNVDASVILGAYPAEPLLGASFLGRVNMTRTGKKLELKKSY